MDELIEEEMRKSLRALLNGWRVRYDLRPSEMVLELYAAASHYCPANLADPIEALETRAIQLIENERRNPS